MRFCVNGVEFYAFRNHCYLRENIDHYYGSRTDSDLAEKHFDSGISFLTRKRLGDNLCNLIEFTINSTAIPEMVNPPKTMFVGLEDQWSEFIEYWSVNFGIEVDERLRFYKRTKLIGGFRNRKEDGMLTHDKNTFKTEYYAIDQLLKIYNGCNRTLRDIYRHGEKKYKDLVLVPDILRPKKYAYLNIQNTRRGLSAHSNIVVTIPN